MKRAVAFIPQTKKTARWQGGLFFGRHIKPEPRAFPLGEDFGIRPGTEPLDAYSAVFDDAHVMPMFNFLDLDRGLPLLSLHQALASKLSAIRIVAEALVKSM
ncbi:hypothetical protein [Mesorhizobium sp.]|uniref:hypothetical protein n=1 Tax=Mesorhizobium sp. TaxID=1871066 RepID=UPI000FE34648|nr:hypothetical protein [Mesorhizobium sp.]RWA76052.1 MAG: hypothetical protein EOQ28_07665 [Mesorhizobium sp.]RWC04134.1 MAG: hypothetical protein EOQ57_07085 [Mesorhizobium sp.]RWG78159.1 MAG: hypothetical protein EOQ69_27030 [Mesorhizobium sp.]RWG90829.1 MAG: hypothetical protein EOQ70_03810 [Mesorhizobium sp.]RWJ96518.1 MAG: hypothetical protein EOR42_30215 [Mesorhizobium sp.]